MCQRSSLLLLLALLLPLPPFQARAAGADSVARAAELIDAGRIPAALALLDARLVENERDAAALLLRSTARFLAGDMAAGESDLRRTLELDPRQRQGWLNLAGLEMAGGHHEAALAAFLRAEELDPAALDNDLNLGAVLLFLGRLEEASARFGRYLERQSGAGQAYYLVATNYAAAGYTALALRHLDDAIRLDEKTRLNARTDPNFAPIASTAEYQRLLSHDGFVPPPGSLAASHLVAAPYSESDTRVVNAVLDALGELRVPFDRRVEVTTQWALVWADVRIKIVPRGPERTAIELSAPPASFTPQAFSSRAEAIFRHVEGALLRYRTPSERLGLP